MKWRDKISEAQISTWEHKGCITEPCLTTQYLLRSVKSIQSWHKGVLNKKTRRVDFSSKLCLNGTWDKLDWLLQQISDYNYTGSAMTYKVTVTEFVSTREINEILTLERFITDNQKSWCQLKTLFERHKGMIVTDYKCIRSGMMSDSII